jgi:hypothetical protein
MTAFAPAQARSSGYAYPPSIKAEFVRGCIKGGGSRAACQCVIRKIERHYSFRKFLRIIDRVNDTREFPDGVVRLIESCAARYQ